MINLSPVNEIKIFFLCLECRETWLWKHFSLGDSEYLADCVGVVCLMWWWGVFTWHQIQHIPVTQDQQDHHWWSSWSSPLSSSSRRDVLTLADWSPHCPSLRETSGPPGLGGPWGTFSIRMEWGWDWLALSLTSPLPFVSLTVLSRPGLLQCSPTVTAGGPIPVKWRAVRRTQSVFRSPGRRPDWAD